MKYNIKKICLFSLITCLFFSIVSCGKQQNNSTDSTNDQQLNVPSNADTVENQQPNTSFDTIINEEGSDVSFDVDYGIPAKSEEIRYAWTNSYDYYEYDGYGNYVYEKHAFSDYSFSERFFEYEIEDGRIVYEFDKYKKYDANNSLITEELYTFRYEYTENFEELTCYIYNDETNELCITEKYIGGKLFYRVFEPALVGGQYTIYMEYDENGKETYFKYSDIIDGKPVESFWRITVYNYDKNNRLSTIQYREGNVHQEKGNDGLTYSASNSIEYCYYVKSYELENGIQQDYHDKDGNFVETHIYLDL